MSTYPDDPLLKWDEAAKVLNVAPPTIREWTSLKKIPHIRMGRAVRYRRSSLLEWAEKNRVDAVA